ncbi:MAG: NADH-ubiquinone oxidoreductase subunit [Nocardioidaceae bacterium]|nr:NADH-ubiquinone oxidoreductase subunit [Nocardioidaceae bacterium]
MSSNLTLAIVVGVLIASGVTLLLERSLTRILVGIVLIGNGVNILFLMASGPAGNPPIVGDNPTSSMADSLPQAMALTAIVITLGVTAFGLALAYRSWQINGNDDVQDDVEDALIRRLAERDDTSTSFDDSAGGELDEEGSDTEGVDRP